MLYTKICSDQHPSLFPYSYCWHSSLALSAPEADAHSSPNFAVIIAFLALSIGDVVSDGGGRFLDLWGEMGVV
jgi:hypothetical protein